MKAYLKYTLIATLVLVFVYGTYLSVNAFKNNLIYISNLPENKNCISWQDTYKLDLKAFKYSTISINNQEIKPKSKSQFTYLLNLHQGTNQVRVHASFLFLHKDIAFSVTRMKQVSLTVPKQTGAPEIKITGTINPNYTLKTDQGLFRPDEDGQVSVIINFGYNSLNLSKYLLNIKVVDEQGHIIYEDVFKIHIDKRLFVLSLIEKAAKELKKTSPGISHTPVTYNLFKIDSKIYGVISFETSDKIDNTEVVCIWQDGEWQPLFRGTMMEIREECSSQELFDNIYDFKARKKLLSLKEQVEISDVYAQDRANKEQEAEKELIYLSKLSAINLGQLNREYLKYTGATINVTGFVYKINQHFTTTDALLREGKDFVHVRIYQKTPLKIGDKVTFFGLVKGQNTSYNLNGKPIKVVSLICSSFKKISR